MKVLVITLFALVVTLSHAEEAEEEEIPTVHSLPPRRHHHAALSHPQHRNLINPIRKLQPIHYSSLPERHLPVPHGPVPSPLLPSPSTHVPVPLPAAPIRVLHRDPVNLPHPSPVHLQHPSPVHLQHPSPVHLPHPLPVHLPHPESVPLPVKVPHPITSTSLYEDTPSNYAYGYSVHDDYHGTDFGASEVQDGYATSGEYHVRLPDGRLQTVKYHADDATGYVADVSYL